MSISRWFKKPSFSHGAPDIPEPKETAPAESSPLSEPPSSFVFDDLLPTSEQEADAQLKAALQLSAQESVPTPSFNESFRSIETEATGTSQRIIKNGKQTVISSDGEETDSDCSLEDVGSLFPRVAKNKASAPLKPVTSPKKWKYNLDSLVHEAVDDNEIEATVDRYRSNLAQKPKAPAPLGNKLDESMLLAAIGQKEDGPQPHRVLGAIRRTNAFDYDRNWLFFDPTQELPPAPEFPQHLCAPGAQLDILSDRGSRERLFMSTDFILTALSKGILSDDIVLWMFHSIPYERDELNAAFCRIMKSMDPQQLGSIIRRADVDKLFERLGTRKEALDPSYKIAPMSHHGKTWSSCTCPHYYASSDFFCSEITTATKLKNHAPLISVLKMFQETEIISSWVVYCSA
ncbi:unnamed protein product [Penicillium salamii]|uniref:Uncharacterized protein n=1 Tax=Penicillium salamii TaxID=1612424 RepID=A0A9W4JB53_9EURO|nr:unnamed protein product [Penicillium salamii]